MIEFTTINVEGERISRAFTNVEAVKAEYNSDDCGLPANDDVVVSFDYHGFNDASFHCYFGDIANFLRLNEHNGKRTCYIVSCSTSAEENELCAFWNENDAKDYVKADADAVYAELVKNGYDPVIGSRDDYTEVYVPDGNTYYEWTIRTTTIE